LAQQDTVYTTFDLQNDPITAMMLCKINIMALSIFASAAAVFGSNDNINASPFRNSYLPLAPPIHGDPSPLQFQQNEHFQFGSKVEISEDGMHMLVGASNAVFLYKREFAFHDDQWHWRLHWMLSSLEENDEMMGDHFSLSEDGKTVAIRRYKYDNTSLVADDIEVYHFDEENNGIVSFVSHVVSPCGVSSGTSVKLGKTSLSSSDFGETTFLLVGCESFDRNRGKVVLLRYDEDANEWADFASIEGVHERGSFGWAIGLFTENKRFLQVAVASPNFDARRGMVQVFNINDRGRSASFGSDIEGLSVGDHFGFSMDMSRRGRPFLVVGAPRCGRDDEGGSPRGCVEAYSWSRPSPGERMSWNRVGNETFLGVNDNDRLGQAVAINRNVRKVLIFAAATKHHKRQEGLVQIFGRRSSATKYTRFIWLASSL